MRQLTDPGSRPRPTLTGFLQGLLFAWLPVKWEGTAIISLLDALDTAINQTVTSVLLVTSCWEEMGQSQLTATYPGDTNNWTSGLRPLNLLLSISSWEHSHFFFFFNSATKLCPGTLLALGE